MMVERLDILETLADQVDGIDDLLDEATGVYVEVLEGGDPADWLRFRDLMSRFIHPDDIDGYMPVDSVVIVTVQFGDHTIKIETTTDEAAWLLTGQIIDDRHLGSILILTVAHGEDVTEVTLSQGDGVWIVEVE